MSTLRILVADDHEIVRRGVCTLLASHPGWQVCGEARDGLQAVELARNLNPDVVVLDISMPGMNGLDAARAMLQQNADRKVLILTISDSDELVREALRTGIRGFVQKSDAGRDLVLAIEALEKSRTYFTPRVAELVLDGYLGKDAGSQHRLPSLLTEREREIVRLIAEGKSTREISANLGVSPKTTETHRSNIMRKLKLHSASELILYAIRNGILPVDHQRQ
ncbi:MAG TPA: response regulator transcription factor [Terriglobales bacterium]|nr:response regulator transcription factor [Terriglobales bacterium]